jgi:hypothetical protein
MDDRSLFRYGRATRRKPVDTALDWSAWGGGFGGAVEMCNNNGHCRKFDAGVDVPVVPRPRGRAARHPRPRQHAAARAHRPARQRCASPTDGGEGAMELCVGCKGCKRECPDRRRHGAHEDRMAAPPMP